ncbi:hypothetical protein Ahy_B05g079583 [Arachis hypogaea]|uniref:PB1-like domain-containing protein n=1 Tax=Arachis hypogaea TaxID=3818 RepID=A0A444ZAF9_ARAHY|nr:hypothetical protein Ahy_B05g079583 [Arachis hypogaea]
MGSFNMSVYHGSRFGYDNGILQYIEGQKTLIQDVESDCWSVFEAYAKVRQFGYTKENISTLWYKDPSAEWLEKDLKLFAGDRDTLEMCRIAELRSHVELFVVHKVDDAEEFPEIGTDDVHFTDSEEEYDNESGFEDLRGATDDDRVDKGKGVVNGDFSDAEGFNSDEMDLDYEVGGGLDKEDRQNDDNNKSIWYPIHKDVKDMTSYKWELSRAFKKKLEHNPKVNIKDLVNKAQKKWNLTVTTSMAARSRQATLYEIQGTYWKQYKMIADYCSELLRANPGSSVTLKTNFDDVMLPPYRKPSHRPVKKRKRGPDKVEDRSQSHLSRRGQIQRCSKCGE